MRHGYAGRKLKRTASHRKAMLSNMASSLFEHKRVVTTLAKAKELRSFAEQLITRARHAYATERGGAQSGVDVHNRRMVGRFIKNKAVLQELFDTIAPMVAERHGGYTRITKLGQRRGDQAPEAVIELVDWSNPVDGRVATKARKPQAKRPAAKPATAQPVTEAPAATPAAPAETTAEEAVADVAVVEEAVAEEVQDNLVEAPVAEATETVEPEAATEDADAASADDAPAASDEEQPTENA